MDASGSRVQLPPVKGLAGVRLEAWGEPIGNSGRFRVTIAQRHTGGEALQTRAALRPLSTPLRITRSYYFFDDRLTVMHEFVVERQMSTEYRIVPLPDLQRGALHVRPLKIFVRD
jgi:hypothetical protein